MSLPAPAPRRMRYLPTPQLYQVSRDIHEEHNVASKHPSVISEMHTLLQDIKQDKQQLSVAK